MTYTNAIYYLDFENGNDAARATQTPTSFANNGSDGVRATFVGHGLVSGAIIVISNSTDYNGSWKITYITDDTYDLDTAIYVADRTGDVVPNGGMNWSDAWATVSTGASAARIAPGDTIRIAKSPALNVQPSVNIVSSTDTTPISIEATGHDLVTGDDVIIVNHEINTNANGTWTVTVTDVNNFTLDDSTATGSGDGGATGTSTIVGIGKGKWTNCQTGGFLRTGYSGSGTLSITSSTNATPIVITKNGHGLIDDDVVQIWNHTTNYSANGIWKVEIVDANSFKLLGSVGVGVGGATGSFQKINNKVVVLSKERTKTIDNAELNWTAIAGGDTTPSLVAITTDAKEGSNCVKLLLDSSPKTSTGQAYRATGTLDLSSFQRISFQLKNSAAITANQWIINLCSDTAGATPVDSFAIPAIPVTGRWIALTITKTGGGNLGNNINSIAVYTGTSAPTASSYIYLDNIIATTTNGLSHTCLISKNSSEQGGTEAWYAIKSINLNIVNLESATNTAGLYGQGYSTNALPNVSETVNTYIRETIKTTPTTTSFNVPTDSGTAGNLISFEGGYDTSTNLQTGETFFDGQTGTGYGWHNNSRQYINFNYLNFCKYQYGVYMQNSSNNKINHMYNCNNCTVGIYHVNPKNLEYTHIENVNNHDEYGFYCGSTQNSTFTYIGSINNTGNGSNSGLTIYSSANSNTFTYIGNIFNTRAYGLRLTTNTSGNIFTEINNISFASIGILSDQSGNTGNVFTLISNLNYNTTSGIALQSTGTVPTTVGTIVNATYNTIGVRFNNTGFLITEVTHADYNTTYGVQFGNTNCSIVTIGSADNNSDTGVYFSGNNNKVTTITSASSNTNYGVVFNSLSNEVETITSANSNKQGVRFTSHNNRVGIISAANSNTNYGLSFVGAFNNYVYGISTTGNGTSSILNDSGINYVNNSVLAEATEFSGSTVLVNGRLFITNKDSDTTNNWIYTDGCTVNSEATDRVGSSGLMYKMILSSSRTIKYPMRFIIARIACVANKAVTVKAYMKKDHATNVTGQIVCRANQLAGISSDVTVTKTDDTVWEELTLPDFTPTVSGVVEIEAVGYYVSGASNVYVENMTITQAS